VVGTPSVNEDQTRPQSPAVSTPTSKKNIPEIELEPESSQPSVNNMLANTPNDNAVNPSQTALFGDSSRTPAAIDYTDFNFSTKFPATPIVVDGTESLRDLFEDNVYFRNMWNAAQNEIQRLLQSERLSGWSSQALADKICKLEHIIKNQDSQIDALSQKRRGKTYREPVPRMLTARQTDVRDLIDAVKWHHKLLTKAITSLQSMPGFRYASQSPTDTPNVDLDKLKHRIFGNADCLPAIQGSVQSLAGAAVCEWVLGKKFDSVSTLGFPLLGFYRDIINGIGK
jgi:hypothetical protein